MQILTLIHDNLSLFKVYKLITFDMYLYLWNHKHNKDNEQNYFWKFLHALWIHYLSPPWEAFPDHSTEIKLPSS